MANVNAQSVEDFADRIIYRYPAARFEQVAVKYKDTMTPGLKTLVNAATATSFIIPASGINARFFNVKWIINLGSVIYNLSNVNTNDFILISAKFLRYVNSANYDGKSFQTEFYTEESENFIPSNTLRAINVANIQVEPKIDAANMQSTSLSAISYDITTANAYLVALLQPIVTFYKK